MRELENAIERAVVLGSTRLIVPDDLPEALIEAAHATAAGASGRPGSAQFHDAIDRRRKT